MHFGTLDIKYEAKQLTVNTEMSSNACLPKMAGGTPRNGISQSETCDVMLLLEREHNFCANNKLAGTGRLT